MRVLIIGGTRFVGRHLVDALRARDHDVTLFTRGRTNPGLFGDVEHRIGDRDGGLAALDGAEWDAVIDTCGYVPRIVGASVAALAGRVERYVFISTISVYADGANPADTAGPDESAPVGVLDDPSVETVDGATYGPLKALCERAVVAGFGAAALVVRPGVIVGPHDPTDRFTYWPARIDQGGAFIAPEGPNAPLQYIDARDLGEWIVRAIERGTGGTYNAVGPTPAATFGDLFAACAEAVGGAALPIWLDPPTLAAHGVRPWADLPLWLPPGERALMRSSNARAIGAGLTFRSLGVTVADTLAWHRARPVGGALAAGLSPEREAEVLAAMVGPSR
ncbi:MAG: NAD-dependent epimerase/dehydratase family protein [Ardenticatenales bacterium]|nr:NAD-dependent epimerase/dehydratase family protein [Ardenticatenales bacterium]